MIATIFTYKIIIALIRALLFYGIYKDILSTQSFIFIINPLLAYATSYLGGTPKKFYKWRIHLFILLTLIPFGGYEVYIFINSYFNKVKKKSKIKTETKIESIIEKEFESAQMKNEILLNEINIDIESYIDIFEGKNVPLIINAINKLTNIHTLESVKLLKIARNLENYECRYMANNALGKIEKNYLQNLNTLDIDIVKNPFNFELYNMRAILCIIMVKLSIIDDDLKDFFLNKAHADLTKSLSIKPKQKIMLVKICEILNLQKRDRELIETSSEFLTMDLDQIEKYKIFFYRAEAYFRLGNFERVKKICQIIKKFPVEFELIKEVTTFWGATSE